MAVVAGALMLAVLISGAPPASRSPRCSDAGAAKARPRVEESAARQSAASGTEDAVQIV